MLAYKLQQPRPISHKKRIKLQVGDRIKTYNSCLGTVVRKAKDELGEYLVVKLDILPGEYAYEECDLEKI